MTERYLTGESLLMSHSPSPPLQVHAERTERYLTGQTLSDETVLKGALATLLDEVKPHPDPEHADVAYRKRLAGNLLYKVGSGHG